MRMIDTTADKLLLLLKTEQKLGSAKRLLEFVIFSWKMSPKIDAYEVTEGPGKVMRSAKPLCK